MEPDAVPDHPRLRDLRSAVVPFEASLGVDLHSGRRIVFPDMANALTQTLDNGRILLAVHPREARTRLSDLRGPPVVASVIASTDIAEIPDIVAAGATPVNGRYTAALAALLVENAFHTTLLGRIDEAVRGLGGS